MCTSLRTQEKYDLSRGLAESQERELQLLKKMEGLQRELKEKTSGIITLR